MSITVAQHAQPLQKTFIIGIPLLYRSHIVYLCPNNGKTTV